MGVLGHVWSLLSHGGRGWMSGSRKALKWVVGSRKKNELGVVEGSYVVCLSAGSPNLVPHCGFSRK